MEVSYSDIKTLPSLSSNADHIARNMTNRIGFDLENSEFYVYGSNTSNVMTIGSSLASSIIKLYAGGNSNTAYNIGVNNPPLQLWIGQTQPCFYIKDNNIGIHNPIPEVALDIVGDLRISGNLLQSGTNTSIQTDLVAVNNISAATSSGINFTDTPLYNVGSLQVNSNVTTNGIEIQKMNGTQHLRYLQKTGVRSSLDPQVSYVTVTWDPNGYMNVFDPTFKIDTSFFASGTYNTRLFLRSSLLVNTSTGGIDVVLDKTTFQSDNVATLNIYTETLTQSSLKIGVSWCLSTTHQHSGHMSIDVTAPIELGNMNII